MTIVFIIVALLLLFALASMAGPQGLAWTSLRTAIGAGAVIVLLTEVLNASFGLNAVTVPVAWALCSVLLAIFVCRQRAGVCASLRELSEEVLRRLTRSAGSDRVLIWFLVIWFGILLVIALVAAPNNHDSLTYRLPRVMTWADNGSIEFFQTQVMRQNTRPPLSEWSFLHLFLTTNSDRLFNCVQWCSFVLCALAAVELARLLNADRRGRRFAALLVATTPLAILQATSTQNDLLASFLAMAFVLFGWRFAITADSRERFTEAAFCGIAAGLCVLTKPTLLPLVGIGGLIFGARSLAGARTKAIGPGVVCLALALALSAGHIYRTHQATGTLFGSEGETHYRSEPAWIPEEPESQAAGREISPVFLASNASRNVALLLSSPMVGVNDFVVFCVWRFHELLGIGVSEPAITFRDEKFSLDAIRHEDVIGNLPQVLLFLITLCFLPLAGASRPVRVVYALGIVAVFVALSAVLPWQPWHTRVFLPVVLLGCPLIGACLPLGSLGRLFPALCGALVAYAVPFVTENETRPLLGEKSILSIPRFVQFTRGNYETYSPYHQAARNIRMKKYKTVGLLTEADDPTYHLWPILNAKRAGHTKLYQIDPNNISLRLPRPPKPEAVLVTSAAPKDWLDTSYGRYREVWREGNLALYEQPDRAP